MNRGTDRFSKEDKAYYEYYLSLGYDEHTAAVLALFTYGNFRDSKLNIEKLYEKYFSEKRVEEPDGPEDVDEDEAEDIEEADATGFEAFSDEALPDCAMPSPAPKSGRVGVFGQFLKSASRPARNSSKLSAGPGMGFPSAVMSRRAAPGGAMTGGSVPFGRQLDTDEYEPIEEKEFRNVAANMTSTFRMTTNTASAGVIFNQLRNDRRIDKSMVRIEEMLNYFRYKSEKPKTEKFRISYELGPASDGKKLLYINVQGKEEIRSRQNIVILLDVSGSMTDNAKKTQAMVATIISKLNPGDKVSLVTYSTRDEVVLEGMEIRDTQDKIRALAAFLGVEIYGYTCGSAGIETAYAIGKKEYVEGGNNQVILITDGDLNFGITDKGGLIELIEEKKKSNLFLSVIGIGLYNFKDDKLESLSKHGNGVYRTVNNLADVKKCINTEYASLVNIIAKDVKAQVEFNPEVVESFRLLGFENREISHEDFTNDKVISEPFGSGGYGVALYELVLKESGKPVESNYKYAKVVTTGSEELGTVKVRYKEPLEDTSAEIECVIKSAEENYTDNLRLAFVVYVCAEKLRGSDKITKADVEQATKLYDELGGEIRQMNEADIYKLPEILRSSAEDLNVGIRSKKRFEW